MSDNTKIQWTETTWNPTTGCDRISPGCERCYALTLAKRLKAMGSAKYQTDGDPRTSGPGFGVTIHEGALAEPLRWRKPRKVFVNSMSDLFHKDIPTEFIAKVFAVMALAPQHTFQVLTKRHGRMRSLLGSDGWHGRVRQIVFDHLAIGESASVPNPLPNVWLGVSAENQKWANIRIPSLLETPAAVRFVSAEPLLGPIDFNETAIAPLTRFPDEPNGETGRIDWVIVGGESGRGARPMHSDWARSIRDQCVSAGVAFHFKQWGTFGGIPKSARTLDGRTWDEFPEARA